MNLRFQERLIERVNRVAQHKGMDFGAVVRMALDQYLREEEYEIKAIETMDKIGEDVLIVHVDSDEDEE